MELISKELQTKLEKVKTFMDPGTFLFTFEGAKPLAIHESQLFKNQLVEESTDTYGVVQTTPKFDTIVKRERMVDVKIEPAGIGYLFDSGKLSIPKSFRNEAYTGTEEGDYESIVITPPKFHYDIDNTDVDDKIIQFAFVDKGEYVNIYTLTKLHQVYRYSLTNGVLSEPVNINDKFTYTSDDGSTEIKYVIKSLFGGDNSLFAITQDGYLYIDYSEKTQKLFSHASYTYDEDSFIKLPEIDVRDVEKIYCRFGKCYFLYKNGYVKCTGVNPYGSLGTGKSDAKHELSFLGCDMDSNVVESSVISDLKILHVKDIAIGPTHTVFLIDNYTCIGFGSNQYFQLGNGVETKEFIEEYAKIKFPDYVKGITVTDLGTVALSVGGKLMYCGTFLNHELTLTTSTLAVHEKNLVKQADGTYKWIENTETTIEAAQSVSGSYQKYGKTVEFNTGNFLQAQKPVRIMRTISSVYDKNGSGKLLSTLWCKLYNVEVNGVLALKEDGRIYYSGNNYERLIGPAFGSGEEKEEVLIWTSLESETNDLGRTIEKRASSWSYMDDIILKRNKENGYSPKNIYYKTRNGKWINWVPYFSAYISGNDYLIDPETSENMNKFVSTVVDGKSIRRTNYETFEKYAAQESIEKRYKIDRKVLPFVTFIDKDLKIYDINEGDNIGQRIYTEADAAKDNKSYQVMLEAIQSLADQYIETLEDEEISTEDQKLYKEMLVNANKEINDYNTLIEANNAKIGKYVDNYNYADVNPLTPNREIGTENKEITTVASEIDENGNVLSDSHIDDDGVEVTSVRKKIHTDEREVSISKVEINPINIEYKLRNRTQPATCLRGDLQLSINDEEDTNKNFVFSDCLVWMNGTFPVLTKLDEDDKVVGIANGLANTPVIRMCEHPDAEVNVKNNGRATVEEKTLPSELRWDFNLRLFSWKDISIQSPVNVLDTSYFGESSMTFKKFKYGTYSMNVASSINFSKVFEKGSFILFMNGVIVPDSEYEVQPIYGKEYDGTTTSQVVGTKIILKTYWDYVSHLVKETVDLSSKGAEATIQQLEQTITGNMFTIAFFNSKQKYKKVRLYFDRQCIRNCPRPGNVMFSDIGYNDLIIVDGHYIPYLWSSKHCIEYPETINSIRDSENDFITHSDIYRIRPYFVNKRSSEYTEDELYSYLVEALGYEEEVARLLPVDQVRGIVANSLKE